MEGVTVDSGALIAIERDDKYTVALLDFTERHDRSVRVPAGVLAQVWRRGGPRQARIARLLALPRTEVVPLDEDAARASGALCGLAGTADVIDASVVVCAARWGDAVVTSDPDDIRRLAPSLRIFAI